MELTNKFTLTLKYLSKDRFLLSVIFVAVFVTVCLSASIPIYLKALEQLAFNISLDRVSGKLLQIHVLGSNTLVGERPLSENDSLLMDSISNNIGLIYRGHEKYLRGDIQLVGHPEHPLPDEGLAGLNITRGYIQYMSNLSKHSRFLEGRMALDSVKQYKNSAEIEGVVSRKTANGFELHLDDILVLRPAVKARSELLVRVVGVLEEGDSDSEYWRMGKMFLDPATLDLNIPTDMQDIITGGTELPEVRMLPIFVTEQSMIDAVNHTYPGSLVEPSWFLLLDKQKMKNWSVSESKRRIEEFRTAVLSSMPGTSISMKTVEQLILQLQKRSFLTKIPMFVLMVVTVITIVIFMLMMVSNIVQSRQRDASLLKSRGANTWAVLRLYMFEGVSMCLVSVLVAPAFAFLIVTLSGKLPYFNEVTQGRSLPVSIDYWPFVAALLACLLCLAILIVPGTIGARMGLLLHNLKSARPTATTFLHRYNIDILLLGITGLVFWELTTRKTIVSKGIFDTSQVNEMLLFAPALFLLTIGILFFRFFPLVVRYVSGESHQLIHFLASLSIGLTGLAILYRGLYENTEDNWTLLLSLLITAGALYLLYCRVDRFIFKNTILILGIIVTIIFFLIKPIHNQDYLYLANIGFAMIFPSVLIFLCFRKVLRSAPIWISMALLRMSRSPYSYSRLILLLLVSVGLAVLATTVGGTLEASYLDRAAYKSGTDLRVSGFTSFRQGGLSGLIDSYASTKGIKNTSLGYRSSGSIGPVNFESLGIEPNKLKDMLWYREDFSDDSLDISISPIDSNNKLEPIILPENTSHLGVWIKPLKYNPLMDAWLVVHDNVGFPTSIKLGRFEGHDWQFLSAEIPDHVLTPISLVAFQIVEPSFLFGRETPGTLLLDDLQAIVDGRSIILDDFENDFDWVPIITEDIISEQFIPTLEESYNGKRSGALVFGSETDQGYRGFYSNPESGPMYAIASSNLMLALGANVGDTFLSKINGRRVIIKIQGVVDYFPTLSPDGGRFLITDLNSVLRHLNVLGSGNRFYPNELFIDTDMYDYASIRASVDDLVGKDGLVIDGVSDLNDIRSNPFITAGWKLLVLIIPPLVFLVAVFGYFAYLLLFHRRNVSEIGVLRTIGFSNNQMMNLIVFENLLIAFIGVGLGTWAGFQASFLMVSPIINSDAGGLVVPPFQIFTDWVPMGLIYFSIGVIVLGALLFLGRLVRYLDLGKITKIDIN